MPSHTKSEMNTRADAATPHDVQQLNATRRALILGQKPLTPTLTKARGTRHFGGTPATPHDVQQLNATPASSDSGSETPNTNPHKKREEHATSEGSSATPMMFSNLTPPRRALILGQKPLTLTHKKREEHPAPEGTRRNPNTNPHKKREEHATSEGSSATPHDAQQLNATSEPTSENPGANAHK
ncbi:hypothetical protein PSTT_01590 [Puccinia striiformis]|uniref:Uncharacterized protein n=1 Tax=Puccinia striiformis TaxID=27350 RepID=A0A2S4W2V5_9BASI|nr:hypothetical protein PSTT_01590 [Puccinia striiformis]